MTLDKGQLEKACFEAARSVLFATRPVSVTEIYALADKYYRDCLIQEKYVSGQGRDPNLIASIVRYIANHHAIPPMGDDENWFNDSLLVLIELCCPNQDSDHSEEQFFKEVELGISESRRSYET